MRRLSQQGKAGPFLSFATGCGPGVDISSGISSFGEKLICFFRLSKREEDTK
jgi:hypothetical protein